MDKAGDEKEMWKIVNEIITSPKSESTWRLNENGTIIEQESEIAEIFNSFFVDKIQDLKQNIDQNLLEDPLIKLKTT